MKAHGCFLLGLSLALAPLGCGKGPADTQSTGSPQKGASKSAEPQGEEGKIKAALANLSPEDRKLAEAQKYCVVETENRLGSMGAPFKLLVKDQPVFLCCEACKKKALANPDGTVAKAKQFRADNVEAAPK